MPIQILGGQQRASGGRRPQQQDWRSLHFIPRSSEDDHGDLGPPCFFSGCPPASACSCSYDMPLQCTVRKCLLGGRALRRGHLFH